MDLEQIFQRLWEDYAGQNPSAEAVHRLFTDRGDKVLNDHVAFRTFNDPRINIDVLAGPFLEKGYRPAGEYRFNKKHLYARHYEMPDREGAPRIFISELLLEEFSLLLQNLIRESIDAADPSVWKENDLLFRGNVFGMPSYASYESLRKESEYAAWLYVHGFRANHFTVSVNSLQSFRGIEEVNRVLKEHGFLLNSSGGEVKGSIEECLKQSSTMADLVPVGFSEGTREVPACYYEFAERFRDRNGKLFSGFIADSADKIFESTDFYRK